MRRRPSRRAERIKQEECQFYWHDRCASRLVLCHGKRRCVKGIRPDTYRLANSRARRTKTSELAIVYHLSFPSGVSIVVESVRVLSEVVELVQQGYRQDLSTCTHSVSTNCPERSQQRSWWKMLRASHAQKCFKQRTNGACDIARALCKGLLTLRKLRQGGHQRISVQHIQVSEGGQAIVGDIVNNRQSEPQNDVCWR